MTLVAAITIDEVPFLIGDLLISVKNNSEPHVTLPTLRGIEINRALPREEYYPRVRGLRRKLTKISDWLVVGWSGDVIAARVVIKALRARFKSKRVPAERILSYLWSFDEYSVGPEECTLVGWIADREGVYSFEWYSRSQAIQVNQPPYVQGTGTANFRTCLDQAISMEHREPAVDKTSGAIMTALSFITNLLGSEITDPNTLMALAGGGFEAMYYRDGKFYQVENAVFLFWTANPKADESVSLSILPIAMRYRYNQDTLIVQTMRLVLENEDYIPESLEYYVLSPVDKHEINFTPSIHAINRFDTDDTEYLCNFFITFRETATIHTSLVIINNKLMRFGQVANGTPSGLWIEEKLLEIIHTHFTQTMRRWAARRERARRWAKGGVVVERGYPALSAEEETSEALQAEPPEQHQKIPKGKEE